MLIHNKDDIEFVTEFPCFLGHPVLLLMCGIQEYPIHESIVTIPIQIGSTIKCNKYPIHESILNICIQGYNFYSFESNPKIRINPYHSIQWINNQIQPVSLSWIHPQYLYLR